jgi:SAM-dependent methyltransferase
VDDTRGDDYAARLTRLQDARWKRVLNVQAPYRWNIRRYGLGRTLDVGCGIGRNLGALPPGSVGVDHNEAAIGEARARGYEAYTVDEFFAPDRIASVPQAAYDGMLLSHVVEHLSPADGLDVVRMYLPFLRPGGQVLFICPQEKGYASDPTHIRWTTIEDLQQMARDLGLEPVSSRSFPLPRAAGKVFTYNEFNVLARKG